ncbi:MAG: hypothetical protein ACE5OO_02850, partial [Candidatus Bathyarchaeia archaeon]
MRLRRITALAVLALMAFPSLSIFVGAASLTVATDRGYYAPGGEVEITGTADPNANVTILVVVNATLETIYNATVTADEYGNYSADLALSGDAPTGLYNVTASADGATAQISFTVLMTNLPTLAETLLSHVERSREQVEAVFEDLEGRGIEVPEEAVESYHRGVNASEEAHQLRDEGRYGAAMARALQALHHFRGALRIALGMRPETPPEDDEEAVKAEDLRAAIERARAFLEKVNATADKLEDNNFDASRIREALEEANAALTSAEELLDEGDITAAAQMLAKARGVLGRTMGLLHSTAKRVKAWKAERFLTSVRSRIQFMEGKIRRLEGGLLGNVMATAAAL